MSDTKTLSSAEAPPNDPYVNQVHDVDPAETQEWLESLEYVLKTKGTERAKYLLSVLESEAIEKGVELLQPLNKPYINPIPRSAQQRYPVNRNITRRIKSIARVNAMAMVTRAN